MDDKQKILAQITGVHWTLFTAGNTLRQLAVEVAAIPDEPSPPADSGHDGVPVGDGYEQLERELSQSRAENAALRERIAKATELCDRVKLDCGWTEGGMVVRPSVIFHLRTALTESPDGN